MASPDPFDVYFQHADTDRDGRISGQEAVAFFQGANLNREVLAKVWQYADQGQSGFLSKTEFYNALKLVTVAQTGRDLTPAIVSRALNGPASSQIPAPKIQLAALPSQPVGLARPPVQPFQPQLQQYPTVIAPQQQLAPRPPQTSAALAGISQWPSSKLSSWPGPGNPAGINPQPRAITPVSTVQSTPDILGGATLLSGGNSTDKFASLTSLEPDLFGGDVFTAMPSKMQPSVVQPEQNLNLPVPAKTQTPFSQPQQNPNIQFPPKSQIPIPQSQQNFVSQSQLQPQQQPVTSQPHMTAVQQRGLQTANQGSFGPGSSSAALEAVAKQVQPVSAPSGTAMPHLQGHGYNGLTGAGTELTETWPKVSDALVRRYAKIFFEVDTDRDGKISGIQARDLFLSWHLPREILKQVWDLADQDHNSMLSLREFCIALYLMERFREGRKLPAAIPGSSYFDDSGVQALRIAEAHAAVAQNAAGYNLPTWQSNPSVLQHSGPAVSGVPPHPTVLSQVRGLVRPPMPAGSSQMQPARPLTGPAGPLMQPVQPLTIPSGPIQPMQPKSRAPVMEMNLVNQLNADDQLTLQTKHQEAVNAEKKVQELEQQIMDSKEKMEFYRTKLQEIVLFKTRCDNRLAEITERAASDKREVEALAKRYDDKFKQAGESQSRLLADEAAFRDVQERRLELYNAILQLEKGGDTNALLQSRADRLQNNLDELRKFLNAKCKQLGVHIKPTSVLQLPFGWQPGLQENAAQWDDEWDKFDDEGFVYVREFMEEGTPGSDSAKPKTTTWEENGMAEDSFEISSGDGELESKESLPDESASQQVHSDEDANSNGDASPHHGASLSPKHSGSGIGDPKEAESDDNGPRDHSRDASVDYDREWESVFSSKNVDGDSASWTASSDSKAFIGANFQEKQQNSSGFVFNDSFDMLSSSPPRKDSRDDYPSFGPIRTSTTSVFFDNSVPNTPARDSNGSPFDNYESGRETLSRFDSFSSSVNIFGNAPSTTFARFDSFSSVADSGPGARGFTSFDDSDPFSDMGPFGGAQASKRNTEKWGAFS